MEGQPEITEHDDPRHPVRRLLQLEEGEIQERLNAHFGVPHRAQFQVNPAFGPILFIQNLVTKKVYKIATAEFEWCQRPFQRLLDRMNDRIIKGDFDNDKIE